MNRAIRVLLRLITLVLAISVVIVVIGGGLGDVGPFSYTQLRAHQEDSLFLCRLLL